MHLEKQNPGAARTAAGANVDLEADAHEHSPDRALAQRRLAMKLIAGTGLSMAVGMVLVTIACDTGSRP